MGSSIDQKKLLIWPNEEKPKSTTKRKQPNLSNLGEFTVGYRFQYINIVRNYVRYVVKKHLAFV